MDAVVGLGPSLAGIALKEERGSDSGGGAGAGGGRLASMRCMGKSRCVGIALVSGAGADDASGSASRRAASGSGRVGISSKP